MAKLIGNIIHLDSKADIELEFKEAYAINKQHGYSSTLIIEDEILDSFTYYMQIEGGEDTHSKYGKVDYWETFFDEKLEESEFISLGTWNDRGLEDELRSKFKIVKEEVFNNQTDFTIKKSKELVTYIRESYESDKRGLRWFNFALIKDESHKKCELSCAHHGEEMYCFNISGARVQEFIDAIDRSTSSAFIRVQRESLG